MPNGRSSWSGHPRSSKRPRPEAEALGWPPRGGRLREVAPVGGFGFVQIEAVSFDRQRQFPNARQRRFVNLSHAVQPESRVSEEHAGSLEALRVARPEAVGLAGTNHLLQRSPAAGVAAVLWPHLETLGPSIEPARQYDHRRARSLGVMTLISDRERGGFRLSKRRTESR
jgi:hypothetical protein